MCMHFHTSLSLFFYSKIPCWMYGLSTLISGFQDDILEVKARFLHLSGIYFGLFTWDSVQADRGERSETGCRFLFQRLVYLLITAVYSGWNRNVAHFAQYHFPVLIIVFLKVVEMFSFKKQNKFAYKFIFAFLKTHSTHNKVS